MNHIAKRFNNFDGTSHFAGPRHGPSVPHAHDNLSLKYDLGNIVSPQRLALITSTQKLAFHTVGDTGNDDDHNGGASKRGAVAYAMEQEVDDGAINPEAPCFCYHLGDLIYPVGDETKYEEEFYLPFSGYGNAIVAIPGNHDYFGDRLASFKENFLQAEMTPV